MIKKILLLIKGNLLWVGAAGVLAGLLGSWGLYECLHRTSNDKFCVVCHEMRPMVAAYHDDVHGGAGKSGMRVNCVACHLPQDNLFSYIFTKAKNGVVEGSIHFFGNPDKINWHENRARRQEFVYDKGCLSCHANYVTNELINTKAREMHAHYVKLKDTPQSIGCSSCHVETGHKGLKNILNYYAPEYEFYRGKMAEKRDEIEQKLTQRLNKE